MASDDSTGRITPEQAAAFEKAQDQIIIFSKDVEKLSNKKPDGPLNQFKLRYINQVLATMNEILGAAYRPFPDFTLFDVEGSMPTASDVVMMLSQYRNSMAEFHRAHQITVLRPKGQTFNGSRHMTVWNTGDIEIDTSSENLPEAGDAALTDDFDFKNFENLMGDSDG